MAAAGNTEEREFEGVIGYFPSADALRDAERRVRAAGLPDVEVYLPVLDRATVDDLFPEASPVRWLTILGGLAGGALGLWMTIATSRDYPLVTGGKPIVSLPPFLVVTFEVALLFAAIATMAGFLWQARLPRLSPGSAYRRRLMVDTFALLVQSLPEEADRARAENALRNAGAREVARVWSEDRGPLGEVPE